MLRDLINMNCAVPQMECGNASYFNDSYKSRCVGMRRKALLIINNTTEIKQALQNWIQKLMLFVRV